ncbi:bactofilin family protein [Aquimarina pacifica]|uniref:hypothetical protein n=1 Tax=Aquimarina pacifica TaxID=1296415 RepID=UPI0004B101D9|nr:hypothetical protein [Aquimarina pacifica]
MQFAILISVLVALVLGAFLLLTHVHSFFKIKTKELVLAIEDSNTKIFESMDQNTKSIDTIETLLGTDKIIKETADYHGAWFKRYVQVDVHNRKVTRTAYTGSKRSLKTPNLYLENTNSPLVVVGNTRLEGNSYLPKQGLKAGNISGTYYQGSALYYGNVLESKSSLPDLEPEWVRYIENICNGGLLEATGSIPLEKELKNSFYNPPKIIYNDAAIYLEDQKISGNIILQSRSKIVVGNQAQLTDVILIAPEISVEGQVRGSFQAIATKKIKLGKNAHLQYPSSVILLDKNIDQAAKGNSFKTEVNFIIETGVIVEGTVVYLKEEKSKVHRTKTQLAIAPDVEVIGELYCQGNLDFQGVVRGSLYTHQFIARQKGSVYLNHMYNGKVLINPVTNFAGLPFKDSKNAIAKWLY